jgi:hypothetical protein
MVVIAAHYPDNPPDRCISCWGRIFHTPDTIYPGDPAVYVGGAWYHAACYRTETGLPKVGRSIPWPVAWPREPAASAAPGKLVEPIEALQRAKDPIAVELGRRGGLKGGRARAAKLSAAERKAIAAKAARARWSRTRSLPGSDRRAG